MDIYGGVRELVPLAGLAGLLPFTILEKFFLKEIGQGVEQHGTPAMIVVQTVTLDMGV